MEEEKKIENTNLEQEVEEIVNAEDLNEADESCECEGCCCGDEEKDNHDTVEKCCGEGKKNSFLKNLGAVIVDQVIIAAISMLLVLIFNGILYAFGAFILKEYYGTFLLVAYIIVSILYTAIMDTTAGRTFGKKLVK